MLHKKSYRIREISYIGSSAFITVKTDYPHILIPQCSRQNNGTALTFNPFNLITNSRIHALLQLSPEAILNRPLDFVSMAQDETTVTGHVVSETNIYYLIIIEFID